MQVLEAPDPLVRIAGERTGEVLGSGFVCYQRSADCLIITSHSVIRSSEVGAALPAVWIDGQWQASPIWESGHNGDALAVLRCSDPALKNHKALRPLAKDRPVGRTWIKSFQNIGLGKSRDKVPLECNYERDQDRQSTITLLNYDVYPIEPEHFGSPVLDDKKRVIAVVTGLEEGDPDLGIVAAWVDALDGWPERPDDLFELLPEIFISYSRRDKAVVDIVDATLRTSGFRVWRDLPDIYPGDSWIQELEKTLMRARVVLIFCSQPSSQSEWVTKEYDAIQSRSAMPDRPVIIPVLLPGGEPRPFLRSLQAINLADGDVAKCVRDIIRTISRRSSTSPESGG